MRYRISSLTREQTDYHFATFVYHSVRFGDTIVEIEYIPERETVDFFLKRRSGADEIGVIDPLIEYWVKLLETSSNLSRFSTPIRDGLRIEGVETREQAIDAVRLIAGPYYDRGGIWEDIWLRDPTPGENAATFGALRSAASRLRESIAGDVFLSESMPEHSDPIKARKVAIRLNMLMARIAVDRAKLAGVVHAIANHGSALEYKKEGSENSRSAISPSGS